MRRIHAARGVLRFAALAVMEGLSRVSHEVRLHGTGQCRSLVVEDAEEEAPVAHEAVAWSSEKAGGVQGLAEAS